MGGPLLHLQRGELLLIRARRPDATQAAGFHRWLELGRCVRRGEKGTVILPPVFRRRADDEDSDETDRRPVTYRAAYVFNIAQTDELPGNRSATPQRPKLVCPVLTGGDGVELYAALLQVAETEGILVSHDAPAEYTQMTRHYSCMGSYVPSVRQIWVRPNAPLHEVKTLAHQLAHHFGCHDESNPNNESTC